MRRVIVVTVALATGGIVGLVALGLYDWITAPKASAIPPVSDLSNDLEVEIEGHVFRIRNVGHQTLQKGYFDFVADLDPSSGFTQYQGDDNCFKNWEPGEVQEIPLSTSKELPKILSVHIQGDAAWDGEPGSPRRWGKFTLHKVAAPPPPVGGVPQ
jgi:hypothetical protein